MKPLFEIVQEKKEEKALPSKERNYWIQQIIEHIKATDPKMPDKKVIWTINLYLKPSNTTAVRDLHNRLMHDSRESWCKSYAHAYNTFFSKVKKKKLSTTKTGQTK